MDGRDSGKNQRQISMEDETPDVTVTRIGERTFEPDAPPASASQLPPSLTPLVEPGTDSLMGVIMDPLRENVPALPESLMPIAPTVGEKATQIGIGLGEGAVRYAAPATAASTAFNLTMPYASMVPVPQARLIPLVAAAGAYGGTYLLGDTLADFFPAPPREELVPVREGATTAGGILFGAPSVLLTQAPSALYVGNGVGSRIYKFID